MTIRLAKPEDAQALLDIYAQSIQTPITFEYVLPSLPEFRERIIRIGRQYPYLVAEEKGRILGYAYAHTLRDWPAYQWAAELSIYLDRTARGRGLGTRLYQLLMELLALQRVNMVYGCVTAPNPASEALHLHQGFQCCGVFHRSGYKNGRWWDVLWFEKCIGNDPVAPAPPLPFSQLRLEQVQGVLQRFC